MKSMVPDKKWKTERPPVHSVLPPEMVPVDYEKVELSKLRDLLELLHFKKDIAETERQARWRVALEQFQSMAPSDGMEGMLAVQMIGTHHAALDCMRRAANPDASPEIRNLSLHQAQKLMSLYAQQLGALDKHRGLGQQKVTVGNVKVESGGQAIVGNVKASSKNDKGAAPEGIRKRHRPH